MARKQFKKRTFGKKNAGPPGSPVAASFSPALPSLPSAGQFDYTKYSYIRNDLKRIGIILAGILIAYGVIFATNSLWHYM